MTLPYHLPTGSPGEQFVFTRVDAVTEPIEWTVWVKPRNALMMHITCIGGGGGGGGCTDVAGGGGGGSSAMTSVTIPAFLLPDNLYIQIGMGGVGGTTTTGGTGSLSYVGVAPNITPSNIIAISGSPDGPAYGGAGSSTSTPGLGGVGGIVAVIGSMPLAGLGIYTMIAGQAGSSGGGNSSPGASPFDNTITALILGGTGGGGSTSGDGGGMTVTTDLSVVTERRPRAPIGNDEAGSGGTQLWAPFFAYGGLGGAAGTGTSHTAGGHGVHGSGGGGQSGGGNGTKGGAGDGGNGIVIIEVW